MISGDPNPGGIMLNSLGGQTLSMGSMLKLPLQKFGIPYLALFFFQSCQTSYIVAG